MNPHTSPVSPVEQARAIRRAQAEGRTLLAWSASYADGASVLVFAPTDRVARSIATGRATPLRVSQAVVRDLAPLLSRALAAVPAPAPRAARASAEPKAVPATPDAARVYWTTGEGKRPRIVHVVARPAAGQPRKALTVRPRTPFVGRPFVGEASLAGTGRGVRLWCEV